MFCVFVAFCILNKVALKSVSVKVVLAFLECLVLNQCSTCVIGNYISAIRANFLLYDLPFVVLEHPKVKYYVKSLMINRPMSVASRSIIDLTWLRAISQACSQFPAGPVFRAIFVIGFFALLRLSNLSPHSLKTFDPSRHLTGEDVFFCKKYVKILIKWTKALQTRDKVQFLTLPKLSDKLICPFRAIKALFDIYPMSAHTSLFQIHSSKGAIPVTDSRVRKTLKAININLGLHGAFFTFHDFRRSGATFAYNSHVHIQEIKRHETWSS